MCPQHALGQVAELVVAQLQHLQARLAQEGAVLDVGDLVLGEVEVGEVPRRLTSRARQQACSR